MQILAFRDNHEENVLVDYYIKHNPLTSLPVEYVREFASSKLKMMEVNHPFDYNNLKIEAYLASIGDNDESSTDC